MPPDTNPDAVKRLTDDEVANIRFDLVNTKPSSSPMGLFRQHCEGLLNEHDALCATVRALRTERDTLADELKVADDALENQHGLIATLREQLAHRTIELERESHETQKWNGRANQLAIEGQELREQLADVRRLHADAEEDYASQLLKVGELQSQLVQVTQERDKLRADLELGEE